MNVSGQGNTANTAPRNQPLPGGAGNPARIYPGDASVAQPHTQERPFSHERVGNRERPYESGGTTDFVGHHGGADPAARPGEATVGSILGYEAAPGTDQHSQKQHVPGMGSGTGTGAMSATGDKPSMGQKVMGTVETIVGKATKNEHMVAEGQAKKTGAGSGGGSSVV
ncbi:hypothetical protein AURDEDRAFT_165225 [Auricularia subglabra TFB-10046 SS5]|nr:hypothetical protein AURDEDRAFT_165225 [Auricularia subglabra TFB-10046 SS5]